MGFSITEQDENLINNYYMTKKKNIALIEFIDFRINKYINFKDEIWDFNYLNYNKRDKRRYRMDFKSIPEPYIFYVKMTILNQILVRKNSISASKSIQTRLKSFTKLIHHSIKDIRLIDLKFIENYFEKFKYTHKPNYVASNLLCVRYLLATIQDIAGFNFKEIIYYLKKEGKEQYKLVPTTAVNDYIPDSFFNQIVSLAIIDIDNNNLTPNQRIVACLLIILAETGMRSEELTLLESNKLDTIIKGDKKTNYLKFLTFKIQEYNTESKQTYSYLSKIATKAYEKCVEIVDEIISNLSEQTRDNLYYFLYTGEESSGYVSSKKKKVLSEIDNITLEKLNEKARRYLFINPNTGLIKRGSSVFHQNLKFFFARHYMDINIKILTEQEKKKIKSFRISTLSQYEKFFSVEERKKLEFDKIKQIEFPFVNPHMFRVTVCTKLFVGEVPIDYIMKHLNHLSEDMTCYYNKSYEYVNSLKEGIRIFANITNEEGLIEIESNIINDEYLEKELSNDENRINIDKINKFLKDSKINVRNDLDKIISILQKTNTTIAENEFGICIRSLVSGVCERKKYFSSLSDSYYVGVQLPTFRFLDLNYERFNQKIKIVQQNKKIAEKDVRYQNEFERELNALKIFANKTVKFEIELLEESIHSSSKEYVTEKYPNLKFLINNIIEIKKEISEWVNK